MSKPQAPPQLLTFDPHYEKGIGPGSLLLEALGRASAESAPARVSLEFSTSRRTVRAAEGPLAGKNWLELAADFGESLAGARGLALAELGLGFEVALAYAETVSPLRWVQPLSADLKSAPWPATMTVIVEAAPGAKVYYGRRRNLSEDKFRSLLMKSPGREILEEQAAEPGKALISPPGLPYALGAGLLTCEVKVAPVGKEDDRGRGVARLGQALKGSPVPAPRVHLTGRGYLEDGNVFTWLGATDLSALVRVELRSEWREKRGAAGQGGFAALTGLSGEGLVIAGEETQSIGRGRTVVVSASCPRFTVNPGPEGLSLLKSWVPDHVNEIEAPLLERGFTKREISELYGFFGRGLI
jgi:hypothetical protein